MTKQTCLRKADALAADATGGGVVPQSEMLRRWDAALRREAQVYVKTTVTHAKLAPDDGIIEKVVDGQVEARHVYAKGDYLVIGSRGGEYPMNRRDFANRYDTARPEPASEKRLAAAGFKAFKAKGKVWAHTLTPDEALTCASYWGKWGGVVEVAANDTIVMPYPAGGEVYSIKASLFHGSYSVATGSGGADGVAEPPVPVRTGLDELDEDHTMMELEAMAEYEAAALNAAGDLHRRLHHPIAEAAAQYGRGVCLRRLHWPQEARCLLALLRVGTMPVTFRVSG